MPKLLLDEIRARKYFYRNHYRRLVFVLMLSLAVMVFFVMVLVYRDVTRQPPTYYASNSAGFIIPLKGLSHPNESSKALLKPDPATKEKQTKELPA